MRTSIRFLALLLCLALLTGPLSGCKTEPRQTEALPTGSTAPVSTMSVPETTQPVATEPADDPAADYLAALAALDAESALTIVTEIHQDATLDGEAVVEKQTETVQYQNRNSAELIVRSVRKLRESKGNFSFEQLYSGGKLFSLVEDGKFWSPESEENFLAQQTPLAMLDPANYGSVTRDGDRLVFSDPKNAEAWALPRGGKLLEVSASATLENGALTAQSYDLSFLYAGSPIHLRWASAISVGAGEDLAALVPAGTGEYRKLESAEALLILIRSVNALAHTRTLSADISSTILSQAAGLMSVNREQLHIYSSGRDMDFTDEIDTTYLDMNGKVTDSFHYTESMIDGLYLYQIEGREPETDIYSEAERGGISAALLNNVQWGIADYLPALSELDGATVYDAGDYYLVEYQCNEDFARFMDRKINDLLFDDENKLMDMAEKYAPSKAEGYLAVEKYTWLPTAIGTTYVASHVIDGSPYRIAQEHAIGLSLYDQDTYEEITGEPLPDTEPDEKPTPVFYEVTDEAEHRLWLFGTIHVGDDRTAYLPQAVYDAFDAADALAVEFDDAAFEEELENDPELMQKVAEAYYYTDGSTVSNHLEEEVYESAVRFLKITGQYSSRMEQLRPFVWSNAIENFYLAQGRKLSSAKGVDHRLMSRAREQEKEILNVESGEAQISMLAGYSDALQQLLLEEAMGTTRSSYLDGTYALYDLWCQGDEAVLTKRLSAADETELQEMTEEERALYEEYHTAMETSRNTDMTAVAKGYLDSGKTVFFAVGLAHLLGDGGLVQALRDAGYTVTLIRD